MREFLVAGAALGVAAGLLLTGPSAADPINYSDGPATMSFDKCANMASTSYVEGCSHVFITSKYSPYTSLTPMGPVAWQGSVTGDTLAFPALTWPTLTGIQIATDVTFTTGPAQGTIDDTGRITLPMDYSILVTSFGTRCTLTGTAQMSSDGVEWLGAAGRGQAYDPLTGRFALASTAQSPVTATGDCGYVTAAGYDLTAGTGWYLTGVLSLPPVQAQTAAVSPAKKIKAKGKTLLLTKTVVTNAAQATVPLVTWSKKKSAAGTKAKYATWKTTKSGKVVILTTGAAKRLYVKLTLNAPAVHGYTAFSYTKTWRVPAR